MWQNVDFPTLYSTFIKIYVGKNNILIWILFKINCENLFFAIKIIIKQWCADTLPHIINKPRQIDTKLTPSVGWEDGTLPKIINTSHSLWCCLFLHQRIFKVNQVIVKSMLAVNNNIMILNCQQYNFLHMSNLFHLRPVPTRDIHHPTSTHFTQIYQLSLLMLIQKCQFRAPHERVFSAVETRENVVNMF